MLILKKKLYLYFEAWPNLLDRVFNSVYSPLITYLLVLPDEALMEWD